MSKSKKNHAPKPARSDDAATAKDAATAAVLIPSTRKSRNKPLATKYVDVFATPVMAEKLMVLAVALVAFRGCAVADNLELADEANVLVGVVRRLENSAARARQRIVELNKRLRRFQASLARAQKTAAPDSEVARGLAGLVGLQANQTAARKMARTRNEKKRASKSTPPKAA